VRLRLRSLLREHAVVAAARARETSRMSAVGVTRMHALRHDGRPGQRTLHGKGTDPTSHLPLAPTTHASLARPPPTPRGKNRMPRSCGRSIASTKDVRILGGESSCMWRITIYRHGGYEQALVDRSRPIHPSTRTYICHPPVRLNL
jgi:hypothetical protein